MVVDYGAGAFAVRVAGEYALFAIGNHRQCVVENEFGVALGHIGATGRLRRAEFIVPVGSVDRVVEIVKHCPGNIFQIVFV